MTIHRRIAVLVGMGVTLLAASSASGRTQSAPVSTALKTALQQLGPQFEEETANKISFTFAPAAVLKTQIDKGAAFDVAILTVPLIDQLVAAGKIDAKTRAVVARAGLGVALRAGAPKPDVSTPAALKRSF